MQENVKMFEQQLLMAAKWYKLQISFIQLESDSNNIKEMNNEHYVIK